MDPSPLQLALQEDTGPQRLKDLPKVEPRVDEMPAQGLGSASTEAFSEGRPRSTQRTYLLSRLSPPQPPAFLLWGPCYGLLSVLLFLLYKDTGTWGLSKIRPLPSGCVRSVCSLLLSGLRSLPNADMDDQVLIPSRIASVAALALLSKAPPWWRSAGFGKVMES